jgi:hypothetical protein
LIASLRFTATFTLGGVVVLPGSLLALSGEFASVGAVLPGGVAPSAMAFTRASSRSMSLNFPVFLIESASASEMLPER